MTEIKVGHTGRSGPQGVTATADAVWVGIPNAEAVVRIDPATNKVVATIPVDHVAVRRDRGDRGRGLGLELLRRREDHPDRPADERAGRRVLDRRAQRRRRRREWLSVVPGRQSARPIQPGNERGGWRRRVQPTPSRATAPPSGSVPSGSAASAAAPWPASRSTPSKTGRHRDTHSRGRGPGPRLPCRRGPARGMAGARPGRVALRPDAAPTSPIQGTNEGHCNDASLEDSERADRPTVALTMMATSAQATYPGSADGRLAFGMRDRRQRRRLHLQANGQRPAG